MVRDQAVLCFNYISHSKRFYIPSFILPFGATVGNDVLIELELHPVDWTINTRRVKMVLPRTKQLGTFAIFELQQRTHITLYLNDMEGTTVLFTLDGEWLKKNWNYWLPAAQTFILE